MNRIPFQSEAHKQRVYSENLLKVGKYRNASASATRNRLYTIDFRHCTRGSLISLGRNRNQETVASVGRFYLHLDIVRSYGLEMLHKQFRYAPAVLIRHQTHRYLGVGLGRKHSL